MNSFARFQSRIKKRSSANNSLNSDFILKGYPSIEIENSEGEKISASVVSKQEQDCAYIFTHKENRLIPGSVWVAKDLHLLVTEEITIIKDVNWRKYHTLIANVQIGDSWGFFKGSEKSFINVSLKEKTALYSEQKVVLVLKDGVLDYQDKIVIGKRAWLVQEFDRISTPGLVYLSLVPTTVKKETIEKNKDKDIFIEKREEIKIEEQNKEEEGIVFVSNNSSLMMSTEDGYFISSNPNIEVEKLLENEVYFKIPFGVSETTITYKENGRKVSKTYRVV